MPIRVLRPGLFTTVQDLGRWGWQRYGMVVGGAMDRRALQIANLLVGNSEISAALEMTLVGPKLLFEQESLIAIYGGGMGITVGGRTIACARPVYLPPNSIVDCGTMEQGCRAYLAVAGGFDVPSILDSRSTYVAGAMGGLAGRTLQTGDSLATGAIEPVAQAAIEAMRTASQVDVPVSTTWSAGLAGVAASITVRVIPGTEFHRLSSEHQATLFQSEFEVTTKSDRMGYRLAGPVMTCVGPELISEGVAVGTVQLPPDGQPIVLMADCATTGGYPKIAHVVAVDVPKMAQARAGTKIRFEKATLHAAHDLYRAAEADMNRLRIGIRLKLAQL